eukprot:CAMPEP_0197715414 /NCGR_PEP_ID=MMETSP1434-20131217/582_1 /TAXON_ID=265543 /ORGANISM="Minutocellus polymorphus, Strain CCMP3303" /LENGTH=254 /DNA_ID=CAMNT_0043299507 /DNA_START=285 /DNA_END=1048 /DNA_ORIENTATION=+
MYSRWAEDPVAPDFIPSTETVVSSIAEDETIDIDSRSLEPSEFAVASRPPSDALSGSGAADKREVSSVAKEDLDKTFDLSINGDDEEEGGCCTSSSNEEYADNSKRPAHQNTPNTQATYACEPSSQTMFSLDITEVLHDAEARADNEYLEGSYHHWYNKDYRYCPIRLGGPPDAADCSDDVGAFVGGAGGGRSGGTQRPVDAVRVAIGGVFLCVLLGECLLPGSARELNIETGDGKKQFFEIFVLGVAILFTRR